MLAMIRWSFVCCYSFCLRFVRWILVFLSSSLLLLLLLFSFLFFDLFFVSLPRFSDDFRALRFLLHIRFFHFFECEIKWMTEGKKWELKSWKMKRMTIAEREQQQKIKFSQNKHIVRSVLLCCLTYLICYFAIQADFYSLTISFDWLFTVSVSSFFMSCPFVREWT